MSTPRIDVPEAKRRRFDLVVLNRAGTGRRWLAGGVLVGIASLATMLHHEHPSDLPWLPFCPLHATTGLDCPGCGAGRAVHHLLNLRFAEAFTLNPLLILVGLPVLAVFVADLLATLFAGVRLILAPPTFIGWALVLVILGFGVVRNLPLWPAPG